MLTSHLDKSIRKWHGREHYSYQREVTSAVLHAVRESREGKETFEIPVEFPRQSGKTTAIVDVTQFLLASSLHYLGRPLSIGIFAPEKEQATTDFDRLKMQFLQIGDLGFTTKTITKGELKFPEKWNSKTIRLFSPAQKYLGEVYIFPISKNSNPESKTLDLIIIEESQDVDDERMKKAVFPMGASTNAPRIYIGTAGFKLCYFKRQIDTNPRRIVVDLKRVFKERREASVATGNKVHLLYESYVNHEIFMNGIDSDYIQTQFNLKWIIGRGQFTTAEEIDAIIGAHGIIEENHERPVDPKNPKKGMHEPYTCYAGIDTAKHIDRTVVTVIRENTDLKKTELCGWLSLHGDNYEDQFDYIKKYLERFENLRCVGIDATGQGDFMPDKFERHTPWNILRVKFSAETKDVLFKNLLQVIKNKLTIIPNAPESEDYRRFRQELLDMQKEYKGRLMSCHHPEGTDDNGKPFHDDYPDAWAIAEFTLAEYKRNEPMIS